ncbi:hypothetical protein Tco_0004873 [Tanacetum coccineum]
MLAPRSAKAKHSSSSGKSQGIRNLSGSPSFSSNFLRSTAEQFSFNGVFANSNNFSLLEDLVMNFILDQEERSRYDAKNSNPQSAPQVLPSFEENTPPVTYPDEVEEIIGIPIEVEPLDETPLEDLGLNTCNHDIPLSSREIPNFNESEPQPQPLPSCPSLDISLGEERGPEPPIKPHSPNSFRMKVVDNLTINIPPSPHVASFYPKDVGSLGVDFLNFEMIEDDWRLESKEVSFLREGLNLPVWQQELEKGNFSLKTKRKSSQCVETALGLNPTVSRLQQCEDSKFFRLYLTRRSLEVIRKFHWTTLRGRSNQLSHVSSPLLSKPGESLA